MNQCGTLWGKRKPSQLIGVPRSGSSSHHQEPGTLGSKEKIKHLPKYSCFHLGGGSLKGGSQ